MPILNLQRRARELGRIRTGAVTQSSNGKLRPTKLDRFRLTSPSRELLDKVAALYGGEVREWTPQNGGSSQWEVLTTSTRLPVLVPPQPVSQYYESWSGGGCQRRCDGVTELLSDKPCLCSPDPQQRECKPTTRLNVVLAEVEGIGVWRLESHGYYSAVELPEVAEFLASTKGYVAAWLALEERVVKRGGETKRFMVPTLEVDVTPAALLAGAVTAPALKQAGPQALPAATGVVQDDGSMLSAVAAAATREDLTALWEEAERVGVRITDVVRLAFQRRAAKLAPVATEAVSESDDPNVLWQQVMTTVPEDWSTDEVERDFHQITGVAAEAAGVVEIRAYLDHLAGVPV